MGDQGIWLGDPVLRSNNVQSPHDTSVDQALLQKAILEKPDRSKEEWQK